jgi:hypothetical protein
MHAYHLTRSGHVKNGDMLFSSPLYASVLQFRGRALFDIST